MSEAEIRHLHLGLAEHGKLAHVEGRHGEALEHLREAMRIAVHRGEPEVFFRHYLECTIEVLEHMQAYDEVLEYCDRACELYAARPPADPLHRLDLATIHQRRGAVLFKRGDIPGARAALEAAIEGVRPDGRRLPLAELLLGWARRGMKVDAKRILAEQERSGYFTVRKDTVDPSRAIRLPPALRTTPPILRR